MAARAPQLAGIRFAEAPTALDTPLPRMDVAGFVGFAADGPIHTPVAVESIAEFTASFGGDLRLAWDGRRGQWACAYLAPAVRSFFLNGGRRCWVVRVPAPAADDLAITADLFLDEALKESSALTLLDEADFLRYGQPEPRDLRGVHALLSVEEVTLIAVPDAVHPGWLRAAAGTDASSDIPAAERSRLGAFGPCLGAPAPPVLDPIVPPAPGAPLAITWVALDDPAATYALERASRPDFSDATLLCGGEQSTATLLPAPGGRLQAIINAWPSGTSYVRVRARAAGSAGAWSDPARVEVYGAPERVLTGAYGPDDPQSAELVRIHTALVRMCAARGDMVAVLSLPLSYREQEALAHSRLIRQQIPDARTRSFGAIYHPWLYTRESSGQDLRLSPPDGAICGMIARRTADRGAWVAPANAALQHVVALTPSLAEGCRLLLQEGAINVIRHAPRGFVTLSANTLAVINPARLLEVSLPAEDSGACPLRLALPQVNALEDDPDLRPLNVRRLLILLRRLALRLGATYVFEPNSAAFQRMVQRGFEDLLEDLYLRGALAGSSARSAFQVTVGPGAGLTQAGDRGELLIELRVAPSRPLSFLKIWLVQSGDQALTAQER